MIAVTGAAGFIGSNIVRALNARGMDDVLAVDEFHGTGGTGNLDGCKLVDRMDKSDFRQRLLAGDDRLRGLRAVLHQGACTNTMERNEAFMLENNTRYSMDVLGFCQANRLPFIYASSAAVYGTGTRFHERPDCESPVNVYGRSKKLFDDHVRTLLPGAVTQIVGLRYFNVYGPHEGHKGAMASVAFHLDRQLKVAGKVRLFRGSGGYADGEQRRDFISVQDVVKVNLWFLDHATQSGIFNVGTGRSRSFNEVAQAVMRWHKTGTLEYIDFPVELADAYQSYTQADLHALRQAGYTSAFLALEEGMQSYLDWLNAESPHGH